MLFSPIVLPRTLMGIGLALIATSGAGATTLIPLASPALWQRAEFRVADGPTAKNPFDPDELRVDAAFVLPSGRKLVVPAFWFQDYRRALVASKEVLTAVGAPEWRVRFTPTEPGAYHLALTTARDRGAAAEIAALDFTVAPATLTTQHGWVGVTADKRGFVTSDGRPLPLVGENVCWPRDRGTYEYDEWFEAMRRNGENFARLWMAPWWAPLEHVPGTLNHYRLDAAWELDHVFDAAEQCGIYLVLCFDHHGMYQVDNANWGGSNNYWKSNPYNAKLGGPAATPNDFFADPQARVLYEKRVRYLIARYGNSPHLLAWQLLNEIDNVYGELKPDDVLAWHREIGRWLHAHDPYGHLVTTSLTGGSIRPEMWQLPEMDVAIYHSYADPAPARRLAALARQFATDYHKPFLIDEFGTSARGWDIAGDPYLRGLRQGLWGGALGGSTGTAMPWWWEDIHAADAYPLFRNLAQILAAGGWREGDWRPAELAPPETHPAELGAPLSNATPVDVELPLDGVWHDAPANVFAVANAWVATRAGEALSAYLKAPKFGATASPIVLNAWLADGARLVVHVDSVSKDAELVVRVDGNEIGRVELPDRDGQSRVNQEYDTDSTFELPAGKHRIEISNAGKDWIYVDYIRLQKLRPTELAHGSSYEPEPIGLRQGNRALLYVVSPWAVYPAGARNPVLPLVTGETIELQSWPAGEYEATWYRPQTGDKLGTTRGKSAGHSLRLPLPDFDEDLAGVVAPTS